MSCQLDYGGPVSIFPLKEGQVNQLRTRSQHFVEKRLSHGLTLESRFGAVMKPDGIPIYLVTYSPPSATLEPWRGAFFMDQGPYDVGGTVDATPREGRLSVEASVFASNATIISVRWTVQGPAVGTAPTNIAGMLTELHIDNPGPHAPDCLRDCLALHAPQCVPMREGNEPELVATVAAVAASCLINCRC